MLDGELEPSGQAIDRLPLARRSRLPIVHKERRGIESGRACEGNARERIKTSAQ